MTEPTPENKDEFEKKTEDSSTPVTPNPDRVILRIIENEMKQSYLAYSMSVIVGRALPDVRDGLKPVHRRILYAMYQENLMHNKKYSKCAGIVGDVLKKFHPHGDSAVYEALVRLAQNWNLRYMLVDGQGNFGCFTADTKVQLTDGRIVSFLDLTKEYEQGKKNYTFTAEKDGQIKIAEILHPRKTKENAELVKITLDNGEEIKCTLNHKFLLKNLEYKESKDLKQGESLRGIKKYFAENKNLVLAELNGNHQVLKVEFLSERQDVYDITIEGTHNFALGAGVFVHNSVDGDSAAAYRYCITGDSLLQTDKGLIEIKNISERKEEKINLKILSHSGDINNASKFFNSGKHKTIKTKTKTGYELEGSYNHPILTWRIGLDFKPEIFWKLLENLEEGDIAIMNRNNSLFSNKSLNLEKFYPEEGFKNNVGLPKSMNEDLAFLLGALVSEGSFHNKQILFNNKDKVFYYKVKKAIQQQFKGVQIYERKVKGDCTELSIYEQKVVLFLKNIGFNEAKADGKEIPFSVLQSKKEELQSFLVALFEGDGSILHKFDKRHGGENLLISYDSKSEKLIKQIKIVLLNFGIVSNNPQLDKRNDCKKITITSFTNLKRFHEELGFFSEKKKNRLNHILSMNSSRMSKIDFIPFLNDYLRNKYQKEFIIKNNFDRYNSLNKNYLKLIKIIDKEDKKLIDWLLKNRFYFDQIIEVEKTEQLKEVFSIRVDSKCHSFVANGFINHNTEARLSRLAEELLEDIDKETVQLVKNYDGTREEPMVLPSKLPNLLINGSSGIAVGMATNIPPHNISEICDAVIKLIENPDISIEEIMQFVQGPDFPTGGIICGSVGIRDAYKTGRGKIILRSKINIEDVKNKQKIIVTEIPYMVNKAQLLEQIVEQVREKKIQGISDIRDESDREGMRIVIELKTGANPEVVTNQLYTFSRMQESFGIIMLSLDKNQPKVLNLKEMLQKYLEHRQIIVRKRNAFDLKQTEDRLHLLEGIIIALNHIDPVIALLKSCKNTEEARNGLIENYKLSEKQAQAILDIKLQRLTSLEQNKAREEHKELVTEVARLKDILSSEQKILDIIKKELAELKEKYGDKRRTVIQKTEALHIEEESMIKPEEMALTISHAGYIKRINIDVYKEQKRGGKGVIAAGTKEEDFIEQIFVANTHDYVLFFTNKGRVHWLKVHQVPEAGRYAKGTAMVNLVLLEQGENVTAYLPVKTFAGDKNLFMATKLGTVKKTSLEEFSNPRKGGIIAITLDPGDELMDVQITDGKQEIILTTKNGQAVRFKEEDVRPVGRMGKGVIGIRLKGKDEVVESNIADNTKTLLTLTKKGYGKRTAITEYSTINRGGSGVINIKVTDKNGEVVSVKQVSEGDSIMIMTKNGVSIRIPAKGISVIGRSTQGVRVIRLAEDDEVSGAAIIKEDTKENGETLPTTDSRPPTTDNSPQPNTQHESSSDN